MRIPAYAKINLYLDVMERREDGFHNIKSIMHRVTLCDYVSARKLGEKGQSITVLCPSAEIPQGEGNLVWRAAKLFFDEFDITEYDVEFTVEKNIPVSAGLAGGSADAAAAIVLLNELYGVNAGADKLCEIGARLGSDIPFCIAGKTSLTTGRGEIMTPIDSALDLNFVIAKGGEGVSTPAAYRKIDELYENELARDFGDLDASLSAVKSGEIDALVKAMYNTFEDVVLPYHKEASEAKEYMLKNGALGAMLSGSGPSVFGIFSTEEEAVTLAKALCTMGYSAHACRSLK